MSQIKYICFSSKKKSGNSGFSVPLLCEALKKDSEPDSSCSATCQKGREEGEEE